MVHGKYQSKTRVARFLLVTACLFVAMVAKAQNVKFTGDDMTLKTAIATIERQTNMSVDYDANRVNTDIMVRVRGASGNVHKALSAILKGTGYTYEVSSGHILIKKAEEGHTSQKSSAGKRRISGVVKDKNGEPIIGAAIRQTGSNAGAITDLDGRFSLMADPDKNLQISYVGYKSQTLRPSDNMSIVMQEDQRVVDEVVVIGYGAVKKSDLTGAVASLKGDELTRTATNSPVAALEGRAAGVQVNMGSGSPDATPTIKIRGTGTPNDSSPLYVVDGFPMSDINYLNPNDIASLEVLKDASACAIYGSRGANGVVLITTKQGKAGATKVDFNAYYGIENIPSKPTMLNSSQYAALSNEAYENAGLDPIYSSTKNLQYDTDWYDAVSRTGTLQQYNINLSGGTDKLQSMFSANYYKREGVIKSTDYDRITLSENNVFKPASFITFKSSMSYSMTHNKGLDATSVFMSSLIAPPDIPVIDPETNYYTGIRKMRLENPAGRIARNNNKNRRTSFVGNFSVDLTFLNDFVFTSRYGIKIYNRNDKSFTPVFYETADNSTLMNTVYRTTRRTVDWTWENILTWHHNYADVHDITVMGATSARKFHTDYQSVSKQNTPSEAMDFWYFDSATENPLASGNGAALTMLSYLGRINYSLMDRYLLTASIRADGSSRFTKDNRWGYFPSVSLAWRFSEEPFFKNWNISWWNSGKLRAGYGEIGNENISSYYPYLTPISQQYYYTLGTNQQRINGATPSAIGNVDTKWETSKQWNIGADLSFFNNRLNVTMDYFIRKTNNILLSQQIPEFSGFENTVRNVGGMQNKGFEFTATYRDHIKDFNYDISGNFSIIRNKVTDLGSSKTLISGIPYDYTLIDLQGALGNMIRNEVGRPYGSFYGYVTDGIFQNEAEINAYKDASGNVIQPEAKPGDFKFKDRNNNGKIDDGDMTYIGDPMPDITFGLTFNATWRHFDLNLLFQGQAGNDIYNGAKYYFMRFDGKQNVSTDYLKKYWHGEGTSNCLPATTHDISRNARNFRNSDFYIEDGSYLRLKTLQLGYTFNPLITQNFKPTIRVYFAAQNLFTITGYSGFDPEVSTDYNVDRGQYPQSQSFMLGTTINF